MYNKELLIMNNWPAEYQIDLIGAGLEWYPPSYIGYAMRGLGAYGGPAILPDRPSAHEYVKGINLVMQDCMDQIAGIPIWIEDPFSVTPSTGQRLAIPDRVVAANAFDIVDQLRFIAPERDVRNLRPFSVMTHAVSPEAMAAIDKLNSLGLNAGPKYGEKRYEYPNEDDRSGFSKFAEKYGIPYPPSRVVMGFEEAEIETSYDVVVEDAGDTKVWLKLAATGGGFALKAVNNIQELREQINHWEQTSMRQPIYGDSPIPLELQGNIPGIILIGSFQYSGGEIITPAGLDGTRLTEQMFSEDNLSWVGNMFNLGLSKIPDEYRAEIIKAYADYQALFMSALKTHQGEKFNKSVGGLDWALVDLTQIVHPEKFMGKLYQPGMKYGFVTIEHNGGRVSDGQLPLAVAQRLGITHNGRINLPMIGMKGGKPAVNLAEVWDVLRGSGLGWRSSDLTGVVPWSWIYDPQMPSSHVLIVGADNGSLRRIKDDLMNVVDKYDLWSY